MATRYFIEPHIRRGVVYGLHSGDGVIRYVGKTVRLKARMTEHIIHSRDVEKHPTMNVRLAEWLNGIEIMMVRVLEDDILEPDLDDRERHWILHFGMDALLNQETSARRPVRGAYRTRRGRMLFSPAQVEAIRSRAARGETRVSLALEMGVHRDTIEKIVNGRTYPR